MKFFRLRYNFGQDKNVFYKHLHYNNSREMRSIIQYASKLKLISSITLLCVHNVLILLFAVRSFLVPDHPEIVFTVYSTLAW
jgi:hypothetical protein